MSSIQETHSCALHYISNNYPNINYVILTFHHFCNSPYVPYCPLLSRDELITQTSRFDHPIVSNSIVFRTRTRWMNRTFFSLLNCRSKLFKPRRYQHIMNRHSWLVHHRPGSNKLTNEKSCARLTDRERSVLAGDRALYPLPRDSVATQRRIHRSISDIL